MNKSLSYIIPAYNASLYIKRCLDSIYAIPIPEETYEVIVVDDCSTDNTLDVLKEMQKAHPNLVVLHQETNQRQGAARNRGIEIARGEYVAFCDADDAIVADGVMNALRAVEKSHVDICYFDFEYEKPNGEWQLVEVPKETRNTIFTASDYLNNYYTCYYNAPWRNLYRTEFLKGTKIRFVENVRWEDCDWTVKVYAKAKEIQFVDGVGYRYMQNDTNTNSQKETPLAMAEHLYAGTRLLDFAREIADFLPKLAKTLTEEAYTHYVISILRFRYITRFPYQHVSDIYTYLDSHIREQLAKYDFGGWINFSLRHKYLTLMCLKILIPIIQKGRKIKHAHVS